jgi:hypothetical protein
VVFFAPPPESDVPALNIARARTAGPLDLIFFCVRHQRAPSQKDRP